MCDTASAARSPGRRLPRRAARAVAARLRREYSLTLCLYLLAVFYCSIVAIVLVLVFASPLLILKNEVSSAQPLSHWLLVALFSRDFVLSCFLVTLSCLVFLWLIFFWWLVFGLPLLLPEVFTCRCFLCIRDQLMIQTRLRR